MLSVWAACSLIGCAPQKEMGYAIIPQEFYPDPEVMNGDTQIEIYAHQMGRGQDSGERRAHKRSMYETKQL